MKTPAQVRLPISVHPFYLTIFLVGLDIADFLLANIEGPESRPDVTPIGEELVKMGVLTPLGHEGFKPEASSFYRVTFSLPNMRHAIGAAQEAITELVRHTNANGKES